MQKEKTDVYKKNNSSQYMISCDKPQKLLMNNMYVARKFVHFTCYLLAYMAA